MADKPNLEQLDKFKAAARELEANEDEARWDATLKKVARPLKTEQGSPSAKGHSEKP